MKRTLKCYRDKKTVNYFYIIMKNAKKYAFAVVLLIVLKPAISQHIGKKNFHILQAKTHYTFVAAHHEFMTYYQNAHFPFYEISLGGICVGDKPWHQRYGYPHNGIGISYIDTKNQYLGQIYSAFYYIDFAIMSSDKLSFNFNISSGLAWHDKIFDVDENYQNMVIATRLNGMFNLEFVLNIYLTKQLKLISGFDFTHTSNGLVKTPNLGINMPALNAGISYDFDSGKPNFIKSDNKKFIIHNDLLVSLSAGYKDLFIDGNYLVSTLSIDYGKHLNHKLRPGLGMEIYYDGSLVLKVLNDDKLDDVIMNKLRYGLFVSNYFKFGKITVIAQPGIVFMSKTKMGDRLFQNIGFLYKISPRIHSRILLRTHVFTADFIEWGIAYKIGKLHEGSNFND